MAERPLRLLYLGFALPPELERRHPYLNPAGQKIEAALLARLARLPGLDLRVVSVLPRQAGAVPPAAPGPEWRDALLLPSRGGALLANAVGLARLRRHLRRLERGGWAPDAVLCYNLNPLYNAWLRGLRGPSRPALFCLFADAPRLERERSAWKRFRRRLKPFHFPDREMVPLFDGFVTFSGSLDAALRAEGRASIWMPGACDPAEARPLPPAGRSGPVTLGYYGALGEHAGADELVAAHAACPEAGLLRLCGYGKRAASFRERCARHPNQRFEGTKTPAEAVAFGAECDILVNPRPASHGNENNFPSKLFSYVLSGAAIATTRIGGVPEVLGEHAFYLDERDLAGSLERFFRQAASADRAALRALAEGARARVLGAYTWEAQAGRIAAFLAERTAARKA